MKSRSLVLFGRVCVVCGRVSLFLLDSMLLHSDFSISLRYLMRQIRFAEPKISFFYAG